MNEIIEVDNYNIATMTAKNWNFYIAGKKISNTLAVEGLRVGAKITAKYKHEL